MLRVNLNVNTLTSHPHGQHLLKALLNSPKAGGFLKPLFERMGIDPLTQLHTVMAFANGKPPANAVIALRGDLDPSALLDAVADANPAAQRDTHAGQAVVNIPGKSWISALNDVFFSSSPANVQTILDNTAAGQAIGDDQLGGVLSAITSPDTSHDLVLRWDDVRNNLDAFGANQRPPQANKIVSIDAELDLHPGATLDVRITFEDEASATAGLGMSNAVIQGRPAPAPLAMLGVKKLSDHIRFQQSGPEVALHVSLPEQMTLAALGMIGGLLSRG